MTKHIRILILFLLLTLLTGAATACKKSRGIHIPADDEVKIIVPSADEANSENQANENINSGPINILTGLSMEEENINRRPIAVIFDNQYSARPQSGLDEADVIFEFLAEGRITRYMGIFYGNRPKHIGPVRSARPYFLVKALEFDPYFVHVGGSMEALSKIKAYKMADIDALSSSAFWREKHKKAPHNMYTSSEVLLKDASNRKYKEDADFIFHEFFDKFTELDGDKALEIVCVYKEPTKTDKIGYATSYKYNDEEKLYYRYTNGEPHKDETSKTHLTCSNIIVQYANTKVLDSEGRLQIDLIGSGTGDYFTGGAHTSVTWEKKSESDLTRFYDSNGAQIKINTGVTWIQVMEAGKKAIIKNESDQ